MDDSSVKAYIKELREAKGITQEDMAERLGLGRNTYRQIEAGDTHIINPRLVRIAEILNVDVTTLLNGFDLFSEDSPLLTEERIKYSNTLKTFQEETCNTIKRLETENKALHERVRELEENCRNLKDLVSFQRRALCKFEESKD